MFGNLDEHAPHLVRFVVEQLLMFNYVLHLSALPKGRVQGGPFGSIFRLTCIEQIRRRAWPGT